MDMDMKRTALDKLADEFEADVYSGDNVTDCKMYIAKASSNLSLAFTAIRNEEGFQDDDYQQFRKVFEEIEKLRRMVSNEIEMVNGDILDATENIIVQQVNCNGAINTGLAKKIAERYPIVKSEYEKVCESNSPVSLLGKVDFVVVDNHRYVANVFSGAKMNWRDDSFYTDETAIKEGISFVRDIAKSQDLSVAIPTYIGCGLSGGDWGTIKLMIEDIFNGSGVNVKFYHYR